MDRCGLNGRGGASAQYGTTQDPPRAPEGIGGGRGAALSKSVGNPILLNDPNYSVIAHLSNRKLWVTTDLQTNSVSISCPQWHQFTAA